MHTDLDPGALPRDFAAVYRQHHGFVWRSLRHLGVDDARLDDALQDTFLVVHRRLHEFAGRAQLRTWLFEIARRVAARYRRSAAREVPRSAPLPELADPTSVDESVARAEAARILQVFLEQLDRDKSVVFILSELEHWRAPEIAEELDVNLNTVYARLRAARIELDRLVHRLAARDRRPRFRRGSQVVAVALVGPPPPPPAPLAFDRPAPHDVFPDISLETLPISQPVTGALAGAGPGLAVGALALVALVAGAPRPAPPPAPAPEHVQATTVAPAPARPAPALTDPAPAVAPAIASVVPAAAVAPPPARPANHPSLAAELAAVESVRAAILAEDGPRALTLVARYRQRFPDGAFAQEIAAAAVEARCQIGDGARARQEADAFAARWPDSTLLARVRALCEP